MMMEKYLDYFDIFYQLSGKIFIFFNLIINY